VKAVRSVLGIVALALAVVALLVAVDVGRLRDRMTSGDRALAANPSAAVHWTPSTLVPSNPAGRLVGLTDDVALREAIRSYAIAQRTPVGFDNGQQRSLRIDAADGELEGVVLAGSSGQVAVADVLLGVLAFGSTRAADGVTTPADRSVEAFTEAARLDPADVAAKFDLEVALRAIAPAGTRGGSNPSPGSNGHGGKGAGAGLPGRGF
jgi:hypothetical protein